MSQFKIITTHMVVLPTDNIDTDQIIPARFLKVTSKEGLGERLFADWRYLNDGTSNPDFPLNWKRNEKAQVLLAGDNFGCGSSREHAPWALADWGFRAIISTSFADIFKNNALKNQLLPVEIEAPAHKKLIEATQQDPSAEVTIDVESQTVVLPDGSVQSFPIDSFAKHCLLQGMDQLGYLLSFDKEISEYEARRA